MNMDRLTINDAIIDDIEMALFDFKKVTPAILNALRETRYLVMFRYDGGECSEEIARYDKDTGKFYTILYTINGEKRSYVDNVFAWAVLPQAHIYKYVINEGGAE